MAWSDAARAAAAAARHARALGRDKGGKRTAMSFASAVITKYRHAHSKAGSGIKPMSRRWYNGMKAKPPVANALPTPKRKTMTAHQRARHFKKMVYGV